MIGDVPIGDSPIMFSIGAYSFCVAGPSLWATVARLTYQVFAEELGQYDSPGPLLRDKNHERNTYILARRGGAAVGLVALASSRPFSVESRLPTPAVLDTVPKLVEVRLLSVMPEERSSHALCGLLYAVLTICERREWDHMVISAIENRRGLYQALTFDPIAAPSRERHLVFTPMLAKVAAMRARFARQLPTFERQIEMHSVAPGEASGSS